MTGPVVVPFRNPAELAEYAGEVAEHLRRGGLIAYPTETVYGLGCALAEDALDRLAALKRRGEAKPFLLLVSGAEQAPGLEWTDEARALAASFWPGPLTLVLRAEPGRYPARVVGPAGTVAVRESPHPAVRAILAVLRAPISSTSANPPGGAPALRAEEVAELLRAVDAASVVWILDGGTLPPSAPSTIVDCTRPRPRVLRPGAITLEELRSIADGIDA